VFGNPLLRKRLVSSVVTQRAFHFWGNAFVGSAIPTQRLTVITLPWKRLLQTRYNILKIILDRRNGQRGLDWIDPAQEIVQLLAVVKT
jgi:hypothetical protein